MLNSCYSPDFFFFFCIRKVGRFSVSTNLLSGGREESMKWDWVSMGFEEGKNPSS